MWEISQTSDGETHVLRAAGPDGDAELVTPTGRTLRLDRASLAFLMYAQGGFPVARGAAPKRRRDPNAPAMSGKPWSEKQDRELTAAWRAGRDPTAIASHMGRSEGAITSRLVRLGLAEQADGPLRGVEKPSALERSTRRHHDSLIDEDDLRDPRGPG